MCCCFYESSRPSRHPFGYIAQAAESLQSHRLHARRRPPTAVTSAEFATNLTLPRKAPSLGPIKKIKVVDPSIIYLKDATGTTLVELDVELTVD